ncbi:polyhydroxyalkanoate synthase [Paucimonas lemoignei]|uniref:Polyhydroxyalkanoate synthase n=1 Tax=Paucimonas lemoignei TaxID=29443 RepID=A0A4R3HQI3_PAULE|nr:alpha/beta fold hydrolase [Paucimonas lemoignei]TCS34718.1 polyhydroxyalkanoate synthase [Paucimonas lemoignei]
MDKPITAPAGAERMASPWLGTLHREYPFYHEPYNQAPSANLDRILKSWIGKLTANVSPMSIWMAYVDWLLHVQYSPSKQQELLTDAVRKIMRLSEYELEVAQDDPNAEITSVTPLPQDKRFADPAWRRWPFNVISQGFLMTQQWWHRATTDVSGMSLHHEEVINFIVRQILDMYSPSNFLLTNPVVLNETLHTGGKNLLAGMQNAAKDWEHAINDTHPQDRTEFKVGKNLAITPGKVVYRNRLIELIRYEPTTETVHEMPVLFVPAWIMKYYILDLSPKNSLVKYLVDQGYTVFMISWKNPQASDRDLSLEDYRRLGVMDALRVTIEETGAPHVNAVGYCLGGTLLSIAAACMARHNDRRLASMTLFAAQVDFKDPGELSLFIDESQITLLEAIMWDQGYLDTKQMAGAFQLLRSNDLIWSRRLNQYLLGRAEPYNDLMAWNVDATRMPFRMHSEYLRKLFLDNELAEGSYCIEDQPVALTDIRVPIFSVGTLADHVAPWRSTFKIHLLTDTEVTYLLTTGGHNAGVVSPPGHPRRSYQVATSQHHDPYVDPDIWQSRTQRHDGSWWPEWERWLRKQSGKRIEPPPFGQVLYNAPGKYVLQP